MKKISFIFGVLLALTCLAVAGEKHWGYQDSDTTVGPGNWGSLSGDELCSTGSHQTPIDIPAVAPVIKNAPTLEFNYAASPIQLLNNGHTVQMNYAPGSTLVIGKKSFKLLQFHFHAKSEHSIDKHFFPLEAHLVHVDGKGKPSVVVAVFLKQGKHNAALDPLFSQLPKKEGEKVEVSTLFNAKDFLPVDQGYFRYEGSLTTPPCSEGIEWYVLKSPIEVDAAQIQAFTSIQGFDHTSRPIQQRGSRKIEQTGMKGFLK
jgi:carbonic anhydrase